MSDNTKIEWSDATWNIVIGCDRVSPGCGMPRFDGDKPGGCYAITQAHIRAANPHPKVAAAFAGLTERAPNGIDWTGKVNLLPGRLNQPLRWRKPKRIFVNSLSDLFHEGVPDEFIARAFAVMANAPQHTFQLLTKRHARMKSLLNKADFRLMCEAAETELMNDEASPISGPQRRAWQRQWWSNFAKPLRNVWLGVSCEDQKWADIRIPALLGTPAAVRFISAEPLLGPVDLTRWLRKDEVCGCSEEPGERGLSGGGSGRVGDRLTGASLARRGEERRSVGRGDPDDPVRSTEGGESDWNLPPGSRDVRRRSISRSGSSTGVASLVRADSGGAHGEPQERQESGQPAAQPGVSDVSGAGSARTASASARATRSTRHPERDGEADDRAGSGDLLATGGWRAAACPRCGLWRPGADNFEDREGRPTLSWVICGGESGPDARLAHPDWFRQLRDQCLQAGVAYLFKQWGAWAPTGAKGIGRSPKGHALVGDPVDEQGHRIEMARVGKKAAGRELDGRTWDEFPDTKPQEVSVRG